MTPMPSLPSSHRFTSTSQSLSNQSTSPIPSILVLPYIYVLYPMMDEGDKWNPGCLNLPNSPINQPFYSRAPPSPNPIQSLLHLSIILSISFPMPFLSLGPG